ncbi:MAG: FAD:protein FMN transferase [Clostridia bacterium]|nr:FAD:protein FMN transferase [Clostridia bacterium]
MLLSLVKRGVGVLLLISVLIFTSSCSLPSQRYTEYSFDYFDTLTTVIGYDQNRARFDKNADIVLGELERYHKLFDIYHTYEGMNNLATVNSACGESVAVDREIIDLLKLCVEMHERTDGYVNVAMGSVLSVWHTVRERAEDTEGPTDDALSLPEYSYLLEKYAHTDIGCIVIDEEASTVTLTDPELRLDVGAIAKGYATERVARRLSEMGITGYILNVGGNVRVIGQAPEGGFTVAVENPDTADKDKPYIEYLSLSDTSLVTSGVYQRFFEKDGVRYHHIIDKDTLFPSDEGYLSVSVICADSGIADALSTALMCMPIEEGRALVSSFEGVYVMWVTADGEKIYSDGFEDYIIN